MFSKILIANRGIIRATCLQAVKELGARAAVFYIKHDNKSIAIRSADEAYLLPTANESRAYYDASAIAELAKNINADAVHPGYGFLAEDIPFAARLKSNNIQLIAGDARKELPEMVEKTSTRRWASNLGIPLIPGSDPCRTWDEVLSASRSLSYPLLLKPVCGSGGSSIQLVRRRADLQDAFMLASRGQSEFSPESKGVFLETFMASARLLEFPVLRDSRGNVVVLPELDCSVQRRFQKLVIETPAPYVEKEFIQYLATLSRRIVESQDFVGLATVEFLVANDTAYFLEINSYIPPTHAATYQLTGINLIKEQIRIFAGQPLSISQSEIRPHGHVVAVHLNAEDPIHNFQASPGQLEFFAVPPNLGVHAFTTAHTGDNLSTFYDSLVAQIVAQDITREGAISRMLTALDDTRMIGVKSNLVFLRGLLRTPLFHNAELKVSSLLDEDLIKRNSAMGTPEEDAQVAAIVAALALHIDPRSREILLAAQEASKNSFWAFTSRWLNRNKMEF